MLIIRWSKKNSFCGFNSVAIRSCNNYSTFHPVMATESEVWSRFWKGNYWHVAENSCLLNFSRSFVLCPSWDNKGLRSSMFSPYTNCCSTIGAEFVAGNCWIEAFWSGKLLNYFPRLTKDLRGSCSGRFGFGWVLRLFMALITITAPLIETITEAITRLHTWSRHKQTNRPLLYLPKLPQYLLESRQRKMTTALLIFAYNCVLLSLSADKPVPDINIGLFLNIFETFSLIY